MMPLLRAGALALLLTLVALHASRAAAESFADVFTDPEDGQFDASKWLLEYKGFLPVPIIITEPAVGYGGGLGLVFFRESIGEKVDEAKRTGHVTPPDLFGVAGAATENGTKLGAAFGMFTFLDDRWRYRGGIANTHVNLTFYGDGRPLSTGERKIGYTLDGSVSSQQVLLRLGDSNHLIAVRWIWLDLNSTFDPNQPRPVLPQKELATTSSGVGPSWEYDTRDNIFTPSRGMLSSVAALFYSPSFGSDNTFQTYRAHVFAYFPFGKEFVLGTRLDARAARGNVPFYQLPSIDLRGIPLGRFQDENVGVAEAELRWNVTPRWALIGFTGVGRAWGRETSFSDAPNDTSTGVGVRYQIARKLGLYVGADLAWGPEQTAFYIQVGSAWR
jgi:outer membrane protein assembly factor BamA